MTPLENVGICRLKRYRGLLLGVVHPASTDSNCRKYSALVIEKPRLYDELDFPWLTPTKDRNNSPWEALSVLEERIDRDTALYIHEIQQYLEQVDSVQQTLV